MPGRLQYYDDEVVFERKYLDAFDRIRVGAPRTLGDNIHEYELDADVYTTAGCTGGGTVTHVREYSALRLDTGNPNSGTVAQIQTKEPYSYQAGNSGEWMITCFHADTGQANQVREWGLFDTETDLDDGLFYRLEGTDLQIVKRSTTSGSSVETVVNQSAWNVDPMNGSGPSGETLDVRNDSIYECRFQWLGGGDCYWYINGIHVHTSVHHNRLLTPYMRTAHLPITLRIANTGASTRSHIHYGCSTVKSNGGGKYPPPIPGTYPMPTAITCATAGAATYLFSMRLKSLYNSIRNRMLVVPSFIAFGSEGQRGAIELWWNRTLTNPTWATDIGATSGVEVDTAASANSGGRLVARFMIPQNEGTPPIYLDRFFSRDSRKLRQGDTLTFLGQGEAGANADIRGSVTWDEVR